MLDNMFDFDKVLSLVYEETNDSNINPVAYVIKKCELLKNEVDLFYTLKCLENRTQSEDIHLKLIKEIQNFELKCVENCRKNFYNFQERFKKIVEDWLGILNEPTSKDLLNKKIHIRTESIHLRRDIFKLNLIFLNKIGRNEIGSLIFIEPFCLDDFQIESIK